MTKSIASETPRRPPGEDLDPTLRAFVLDMSAAWAAHPPLARVTPQEARRIAEVVRAPWARGGPEMAEMTERQLPIGGDNVRVRCYDPGPVGGTKPGLVFLHGGGWTVFSLDTHDRIMREYAHRSGMMVLGVDYAQAPEARFPVALDQVEGVVRLLQRNGAELAVDPRRVVVAGDSAGANLAVAACLRLRDSGAADVVRGMLLSYGVFSREMSDQAQRRYGGVGYMLSSDDMEWFWENYLPDDVDPADPLVSPVNADLRGLPPAMLVVPECDLLAEQSHHMAEGLQAAKVPTRLEVYASACHSFLEAIGISSIAETAFDDSVAWLRETVEATAS